MSTVTEIEAASSQLITEGLRRVGQAVPLRQGLGSFADLVPFRRVSAASQPQMKQGAQAIWLWPGLS